MPICIKGEMLAADLTVAVRYVTDGVFKAAYWCPKKTAFIRVDGATNGSFVDAPASLREKFVRTEYAKHWRIVEATASRCGLSTDQLNKLRTTTKNNPARYDAAVDILTNEQAGRLRSDFTRSVARQLRAWLSDPKPIYHTPLSPKQWDAIIRKA